MMSRSWVFAYAWPPMACFRDLSLCGRVLGNLVVPKSLDWRRRRRSEQAAPDNWVCWGRFAVQHSVMARPWFKRALLRVLPQAAEAAPTCWPAALRDPAVLAVESASAGDLGRPDPAGRAGAVRPLRIRGFLLVLVTTFLINTSTCSDCGRSAVSAGREYRPLHFVTPGP